jgi:hypothetical protein
MLAGLAKSYFTKEVPVAAEFSDYLLIQPALVVLTVRSKFGALLVGELINAVVMWWASPCINTLSNSGVRNKVLMTARL